MNDFPISDEAVEAVAGAISARRRAPTPQALREMVSRAAIAAFVGAEGLRVETNQHWGWRLVTDWRKRD